jgi:protoporphyrinogen oxidase
VPICGLIEYTNLNPSESFGGFSLVYSPHYAPSSSAAYRRPDGEVFAETIESISRVVPGFDAESVVDHRVFRAPYAQPVCPAGFSSLLAPIVTSAPNLIAADTSHLMPHDRSISDSLGLSERLTDAVRRRLAGGNGPVADAG